MGLGSNWGLEVSIKMQALETFRRSSTALEKGAERIAKVGKEANDVITTLGKNLQAQVKNINDAVKAVDSAVKKIGGAAARAGGGGGGFDDFVFPRMGHARKGPAGKNATDSVMRRMFGFPKSMWDEFAPGTSAQRNKYSAFIGTFPKPSMRTRDGQRERFYSSPQMQTALMKGAITIPIVKSIESMENALVAAINNLHSHMADAVTSSARISLPRPVNEFVQATPSGRQVRSRGPPSAMASSYNRFSGDEVTKALLRDNPINMAKIRKQYTDAILRQIHGETTASGAKRTAANTKFSNLNDLPLHEIVSEVYRRSGMKPKQFEEKLRGFEKRLGEVFAEIERTYYTSHPSGGNREFTTDQLRQRIRTTRKGRLLSPSGMAVNLGHILGSLDVESGGRQSFGRGSDSATHILSKWYNQDWKKFFLLFKAFAAKSGVTLDGKTDTPSRKGRRGGGISAESTLPSGLGLQQPLPPGGASPKQQKGILPPGSRFRGALERVINWGAAGTLVYGGAMQLKQGIQEMAAFETEVNKVRRVMNPMVSDFNQISEAATKMGTDMGADIDEVARVMATYAKQGMNMKQVVRETQTALMAMNTTEMSSIEAVDGLIAAQREFLLGTSSGIRILDSWLGVEKQSAVSTNVLADATKAAGTASRTAGVDFDTFNGIVGAVGETTRKSGEAIGNSLKYIFQHMRDVKSVQALQQVGVFTEDAAGNFRSARDTLAELATKWDKLTDAQRNNVALTVAGTEHVNDFYTLMETFPRAIDLTVVSLSSQGTAMRANAIVMEGLQKKVDQMKAAYRGLFNEIGQSGLLDLFKGMADFARQTIHLFTTANKTLGGLPAGIAGTGALLAGGMGAASWLHEGFTVGTGPAAATAAGGIAAALNSQAPPGKTFRQRLAGKGTGIGMILAGTSGQALYNAYARQAAPGTPPTLRDMLVGQTTNALDTGGLLSVLGWFKKGARFGKGALGKAGGAAVLLAGLMEGYEQFQQYRQASNPQANMPVDARLADLEAQKGRISTLRSDIRMVQRQSISGESMNGVDVTKIQGIKDAMAAVDPSFESAAKSTQEFLEELKGYPDILDKATAALNDKGAQIIAGLLNDAMNDQGVQAASRKLGELLAEQSSKGLSDSPMARQQRLADIQEQREFLNDSVMGKFRAQMTAAGLAGTGMGTPNYGQLANTMHMPAEQLAMQGVKDYLTGVMGFAPRVDEQLAKSGQSALGVKYYQKPGGGVYDITNNQAVQNPNGFVLKATDSDMQQAAAIIQAKNLSRLVNDYGRAIELLITKNDDLIKNVDSVSKAFEGASFASPESIFGSKLGLQGLLRTGQVFTNNNQFGASNFSAQSTSGRYAVQNAMMGLTGELAMQSRTPNGISMLGMLRAQHALETQTNTAFGGLGSAIGQVFAAGGGSDRGGQQSQAYQSLRDALGDMVAEQIGNFALQAKSNPELSDQLQAKATAYARANFRGDPLAQIQKEQEALRGALEGRTQFGQSAVQQLGVGYARALATGGAGNIGQFLQSPEAVQLRKVLESNAAATQDLVKEQQARLEELARTEPGGRNSEAYQNADAALKLFQGHLDSSNDILQHFGARIENVTVGMEQMSQALERIRAGAGYGGAFGQSGLQSDKFALDFLGKEMRNLREQLEHTSDPQRQGMINRQIDELRNEVLRRQLNSQMTQDYRGAVGRGLYTSVLASRLQAGVGLPVEGAGINEWREQITQQFREVLQQIARDYAPAVQGKGSGALHDIVEQLRPALNVMGSRIHDLQLDTDTEFRKMYLLASPSQRLTADAIRQQIRGGATAEEIFSDPYMRMAAQQNPMLDKLMQNALESDTQLKALDFQKDIADYNRQMVDWLGKIYTAVVNPARMGAGLGAATAPTMAFAMGSLAKAGTSAVDAQGRIKRDFTPAYLDKGEIVLTSKQSDHYLRRNRYASGTLNRDARRALSAVPGTYTDSSVGALSSAEDKALVQALATRNQRLSRAEIVQQIVANRHTSVNKLNSLNLQGAKRITIPKVVGADMLTASQLGGTFQDYVSANPKLAKRFGTPWLQRAWNLAHAEAAKGAQTRDYIFQKGMKFRFNPAAPGPKNFALPRSAMSKAAKQAILEEMLTRPGPAGPRRFGLNVLGSEPYNRVPNPVQVALNLMGGRGAFKDSFTAYANKLYGSTYSVQDILGANQTPNFNLSSLYREAKTLAASDVAQRGLTPELFEDILGSVHKKFVPGSSQYQGRLAHWKGMTLDSTAGGMQFRHAKISFGRVVVGPNGPSHGLATLLRHEPQHAIDQLWADPELYKNLPPELEQLRSSLMNRLLQQAMNESSPAQMLAKRHVMHVYGKDFGALNSASDATNRWLREYRAALAESGAMSPDGRSVNQILARTFVEFNKAAVNGDGAKAISVLQLGLEHANATLGNQGYGTHGTFSLMDALADQSTYGVAGAGPAAGTAFAGATGGTAASVAKRSMFPTFTAAGRFARSVPGRVKAVGRGLGRLGKSIYQGDPVAYVQLRAELLKKMGVRAVANTGRSLWANRGRIGAFDVLGRELPTAGLGIKGRVGGLVGVAGQLLLQHLANSEAVQGYVDRHGLRPYYDFAGGAAHELLNLQGVRTLARGGGLTPFGITGSLLARGGAAGTIGRGLQAAKVGIGRVLLPFEIANAELGAVQGGLAIGHHFGWMSDQTYKANTESVGVAKDLLWSPFTGIGGAIGRQFSSGMRAEHEYLMGGKSLLKQQGISTWAQSDTDYATAMRLAADAQIASQNHDFKAQLMTPLILMGGPDAINALLKGKGGAGGDPEAALKQELAQLQAAIAEGDKLAGSSPELAARVKGLKDRVAYLQEIVGGYRSTTGVGLSGKDSFAAIHAIAGSLPEIARKDLAKKGLVAVLNNLRDANGIVSGFDGGWTSVASALVQNRPDATLLDLINVVQHTNEQDPNKLMNMFADVDPATGVRKINRDKLGAFLLNGSKVSNALSDLQGQNKFGNVGLALSAIAQASQNSKASQARGLGTALGTLAQSFGGGKLSAMGSKAMGLFGSAASSIAGAINWKAAHAAQADASQQATYLRHLASAPQLEFKRDANTGQIISRIKGDTNWSFGTRAIDLKKSMPGLVHEYAAVATKSVLPIGIMNAFIKGLKTQKNLSVNSLFDRMSGHSDFSNVIPGYIALQQGIDQLTANSDPNDPAVAKKIAEMQANRDRLALDSGYSPAAFKKLVETQQAIQQELARRADADKKRAAAEEAARRQSQSDYDNQDTTPIFRPKRHTGGRTTASNEYVLQDTEGLVLTGSRMEEALGALANIGSRQVDPMQDLAKQFLGRGPQDTNLFHEHRGSVDLHLHGQDDLVEQIVSRVAERLSDNSGGVPMKGDRIRRNTRF